MKYKNIYCPYCHKEHECEVYDIPIYRAFDNTGIHPGQIYICTKTVNEFKSKESEE